MTDWNRMILVAALLVPLAGPVAGQGDRAARIDQARTTFDDAVVIRLLHSAMDPALGGPDSLWAIAGYELAFAFLRSDEPAQAELWLRTVARHAPGFPIDRIFFPPNVVAGYDEAAAQVANTVDEGDVITRWRWTSTFEPQAQGTIEVAAPGAGIPVEAVIESVGPIQAGGPMSLAAGTYTISVSSNGWEPVRIQREVLPGTTTMIDVDLVPLLPETAEAGAAANVVRITYQQAGQQVCRAGYFATTDGMVITTLGAMRDATAISVSAFGGAQTFTDVAVLATDADRDLAVLRLPVDAQPTAAAANPATGDYVWSIAGSGCDDTATHRTRVANANGAVAPIALAVPLPPSASGSPLIDRAGLLVGIVTGPSTALTDALTRDVIQRARTLVAVQVNPPSGGGFPWKWVGIGAAAAGLGVALASGGGGNGTVAPPKATTGGIIITFPN